MLGRGNDLAVGRGDCWLLSGGFMGLQPDRPVRAQDLILSRFKQFSKAAAEAFFPPEKVVRPVSNVRAVLER